MKRILTYIFGLIIMAAPFAPTPSTAAITPPTVVRTNASGQTAQTVTVTGTVLDETNTPLYAASVSIRNTTKGVITDENGSFTITNTPTNATILIGYVGYKDVVINLSGKATTNNTINLGTIKLEVDGEIEEVVITTYPQAETTPDNARQAIIYNNKIGFKLDIDQDVATLTNIETRNKRSDKTVICKCEDNYILMKRNHQSFTGTITLTKSANQTVSYDSQNSDGICYQKSLDNAKELEYLLLLARALHNDGLQCVAETNCSNALYVTESHYELNGNQYKCIVDDCMDGYTINATQNGCDGIEDCKDTLPNNAANVKTATYRGNGENRTCEVTKCECGYDISSDKKSCTTWNENTCSNRTRIRGATSMKRFCHNDTEICHAMSCDSGYELTTVTNHEYYSNMPAGISELKTCKSHERKCTDEERNRYTTENQITWDSNIIKKETAIAYNLDGARICIPTECKCGYDLENEGERNAQCVKWPHDNMPCDPAPDNAISSYRACRNNGNGREYCHVAACTVGYTPNNQHDACVNQRGDCVPDGAQNADKIQNSRYKNVNGERTCVITKCVTGYEPNEDGTDCIEAESQARTGDCTPTTAQNIDQIQKTKYRNINGERTCVITKCATGYEPNEDGSDCKPMMVLPEKESQDRIDELRTVYDEAHKNETSIANKTLGAASMAATGAGGMMLAMGITEQKTDKEAEEKMRGYVATFKCNYGDTNVEYGVEPTELPMSTELYNLYAEYVTLANDLKLRKEMLGLRAGIESEKILDSATTGLYDDVSSGRSAGMYTSLARAILDPNGADAAAWAEQTKRSKNLIIAGATTAGVGVVGSIVGNLLINKDKINLPEVKERIKEINAKYEAFKTEYQAAARALNATEIDTDAAEEEDVTEEGTEEVPEEREEILEDVIDTIEDAIEESPTNSQPLALSIPGDTLFDLDSSDVKDNAREKLVQLMSSFQTLSSGIENFGTININITGYTDPVGNSTRNQRLSESRAKAVETIIKNAARQKGLTVQTTATGKGEKSCFITTGLAPDNRTEEAVMDRCADYGVTQLCTEIKNREQAERSFFEIEIHTVNDNATFPPCRRVELVFQLPALSRDILDIYGLDDTFGSIPLDSFLEIINNINE